MAKPHQLFLTPGMFGFGRLASYDYFAHVEAALARRFGDAGVKVDIHVADVPPTASVRRRTVKLTELVSSIDAGGPIHLLGHSTGGLDVRLAASPSVTLTVGRESLAWTPRLRSVTTMNTPHFGTPLANFFATAKGQHLLYALSAMTIVGLSLGARPMALASALVGLVGHADRAFGLELRIVDKLVDTMVSRLDQVRSDEVRSYLRAIKTDQGAVIQLTPEAMDLFQAGVEDRKGVRYQSTASMAPLPSPGNLVRAIRHPWLGVSSALFTLIHTITASYDECYPCALREAPAPAEATIAKAFERTPGVRSNDGVVPLRSQIWGQLVWAGFADHLDVLGHYRGEDGQGDCPHVDWLASGSHFDDRQFDALMDAIAGGIVASA
jgi:triacylglycerol lipase